jgi:2,3-bisphosphoglycerate-independent phosphoglycerate mutase
MDGWGERPEKKGNAIALAKTPNFDKLKKEYSFTELFTHGRYVGLADKMMGGSEVGHLNIGAGRVVEQDVMRVNKMIKDGSFFKNKNILKAFKNVKEKNSTLHLMGLLSDSGVHSHNSHLYALLRLAKLKEIKKVKIHVFSDGRDTGPKELKKYIKELKSKINEYGVGEIATITGRYFAMDRDNRWNRTEKAYRALIKGEGKGFTESLEAVNSAYQKGETDEFIKPLIINNFQGINEGDSVILFNYRADRVCQITKAFLQKDFDKFKRDRKNLVFVCMTRYYDDVPAEVVLEKLKIKNVLGKVLSDHNLRQLRIAETEKRPHVTYFFNGLQEKPFPKEERFFLPSPQIATYDLKPEMTAFEITEKLIEKIRENKYNFILLNLVNADMVGHTGDLKAAIKAVETVDQCVGKIVKEIKKKEGIALITADHGNAEEMLSDEKGIITEHSLNPVPFVIVSKEYYNLRKGKLANIAPTILELLKIEKPEEMTAQSLIKK